MHPVQGAGTAVGAYHQPATVDAALVLLAELGGRARVVAGGTDLLLELARGGRPGLEGLVDVSRVDELRGIAEDGDALVIGAATSCNELLADERVARHALPLAQACLELGAPQLRNRATLAGNVVTASSANDTLSALVALGAEVEIARAGAPRRTVAVHDFVTGSRQVALRPDELVTAVRVSKLGSRRGVFVKLGLRRAQAISLVHLAVVLEVDDDGVVRGPRVALGSVGPTVARCSPAEEALAGRALDAAAAAAAGAAARAAVVPIDDIRGPARYRSEQVELLLQRALLVLRDGTERGAWPSRPALLHRPGPTPPPPRRPAAHAPGDPVEATVNGRAVTAPAHPAQTLLDWLRDEAGLTGAKEGCAEGECGACTVVLDGQPVLACLVSAPRASGAAITTVEGLGGQHAVQEAFVAQGAVQCGFCTPGFVVAAACLVDAGAAPTSEEIVRGLAGNLCRCTGYESIVRAVAAAAPGPTGT